MEEKTNSLSFERTDIEDRVRVLGAAYPPPPQGLANARIMIGQGKGKDRQGGHSRSRGCFYPTLAYNTPYYNRVQEDIRQAKQL